MEQNVNKQTNNLSTNNTYLSAFKNEIRQKTQVKANLEQKKLEDIQNEFADNIMMENNSSVYQSPDYHEYEEPKDIEPKNIVPKVVVKKVIPIVPPVQKFTPKPSYPIKKFTPKPTLQVKKAIPKPIPTTKIEELGDLGDVKSKRDLMNIATFLLKQDICPASFRTTNELFIALQTVFSLGIKNPGEMLLALNSMYLINNKIELFGDLPLALVKRFGDLINIEEFFIDDKHEKICLDNKNLNNLPMAAICILTDSLGISREFYLTENDLKLSGGIMNSNGSWIMGRSQTWKRYPKVHWARRLRGWALKCSYPHILKGVGIHEYDNPIERKNAEHAKTASHKLMEETYTNEEHEKPNKLRD